MSWRVVGVVSDGAGVDLAGDGGVDVWALAWGAVGGDGVVVSDPVYPEQRHRLAVYEARLPGGGEVVFAAGEVSNGVWLFAVPEDGPTS